MLFIILSIRPPRKGNLEKVIMETMKITYEKDAKDSYLIKIPHRKNVVINGVISILYLITFLSCFFAFWIILDALQFTWPSKIIFIIFLSLITFAGNKIKERAKELSVEEEKGGFLGFIIDWFSLPFIQVGKWLSGQWTKYNSVLVFLTTLIDLPFQVLIEFLEQWRYFIKEKKEEIH
jgi:polyferredoxin